MTGYRWIAFCIVLLASLAPLIRAVDIGSDEMAVARQWVSADLTGPSPTFPFSFTYGGQSSPTFLRQWSLQRADTTLDAERVQHTLIFTDPTTHLEVKCVAVEYLDFPTVEWTLYFTNQGTADSPILDGIQALDTSFQRSPQGEFLLHHSRGSTATAADFQPLEDSLTPGKVMQIASAGGRPTNANLSYFNIEWSGQGVILAVGWPGQWQAQFSRDANTNLRMLAGQQTTHFNLLPGEQVRTPLMAIQFWKGDWIHGQNVWRAWMVAHNLPRPGGTLVPPQAAGTSSGQTDLMQNATEQNQKMFIDLYQQRNIPIDYWWMDAGWYSFNGSWAYTGTWQPDPARFPNGIRPVSDHAHSKGIKTILWFEPERVTPGTWLYQNHPEWLLTPPANPNGQAYDPSWRLLNLGDPNAWQWLSSNFDQFLTDQGIDTYRQDFNVDPLYFWQANDPADRQGITENHYVTQYLAYWDKLRADHPNLLIDTCASGGRRDDLETLRRSVPLWRSDYAYEAVGMQNQTYGMSLWIPYFGTGVDAVDAYTFRSEMTPAVAFVWDLRSDTLNYTLLRTLISQWRQVSDYYYGDFFPLTPYVPLAANTNPTGGGPALSGARVFMSMLSHSRAAAMGLAFLAFFLPVFILVLALVRRRGRLHWSLAFLILIPCAWFACGGGSTPLEPTYPPIPQTGSLVAWQFNRSDLGGGMVQVFRRPGVTVDSAQYKLSGLESAGTYTLTNLDTSVQTIVSGDGLMNAGLSVVMPNAPGSALFVYKLNP